MGENEENNSSDVIVYEKEILEAIDQLRNRKARPDADRICAYLLRKFCVDARDTITDLHRLIECEKVIQVDYKGNTSYRNASKWTRLQLYKNRPEGFVKDKLNHTALASALAELVVEEPDYLDHGVPSARLIDQLLDGVSNPTSRRMINDFLKKQVAYGNLTRLSNGNYSLVDLSTTNENSDNSLNNSQSSKFTSTKTQALHKSKSKNGALKISLPVHQSGGEFKDLSSNYEYDDIEEIAVIDSRSNTPHSSCQASPRGNETFFPLKKEDCYEIIIGGKVKESSENEQVNNHKRKTSSGFGQGENGIKSNEVCLEEAKTFKRTTKSERKQRLCVRSDDSTDMLFRFDTYDKKEPKGKATKNSTSTHRYFEEGEIDDEVRNLNNHSPTPSDNNLGTFRSARRKRAIKKVFDPSDNNVVKKKRGRYGHSQKASHETADTAKICSKESPKDPNRLCSVCSKDKPDSLISCRDCTVRAHPTCIYTSEELFHKSLLSWQCKRCKTCVVCYETSDIAPLVTCYGCDDAYHYSCHSPRITGSKSKWHCSNCNQKAPSKSMVQKPNSSASNLNNNLIEAQANNQILPPVLSPQVSPNRNIEIIEDDVSRDSIDPDIPDASDWTSEQVYQYFARLFPKEAEIFRNQDIDGHSLLLLKRSDVLGGLDLLLGPALKIYRHILKLQVRRDDPQLYWL